MYTLKITNLTTLREEPRFQLELKNEETGEIREIVHTSVEAALRTLGRGIDRDFKRSG